MLDQFINETDWGWNIDFSQYFGQQPLIFNLTNETQIYDAEAEPALPFEVILNGVSYNILEELGTTDAQGASGRIKLTGSQTDDYFFAEGGIIDLVGLTTGYDHIFVSNDSDTNVRFEMFNLGDFGYDGSTQVSVTADTNSNSTGVYNIIFDDNFTRIDGSVNHFESWQNTYFIGDEAPNFFSFQSGTSEVYLGAGSDQLHINVDTSFLDAANNLTVHDWELYDVLSIHLYDTSMNSSNFLDDLEFAIDSTVGITTISALGEELAKIDGSWQLGQVFDSSVNFVKFSLEASTLASPIFGTDGDDVIDGTLEDDFISGLSGNDLISGKDGNDIILGGNGDDIIYGEAGDDVLRGGPDRDILEGGAGNDYLYGGGGATSGDIHDDVLKGGDGDDYLDASEGSVEVVDGNVTNWGASVLPGKGNDTVIGHEELYNLSDGIDLAYYDLSGVDGITFTVGENGTGTAVSGNGEVNDTFTFAHYFIGSQDNDIFYGSDTSDDSGQIEGFIGLEGSDQIFGGGGIDRLDYSAGSTEAGINVDYSSGTVIDQWGDTDTFSGIEVLRASNSSDYISAEGHDESIAVEARDGDDVIIGGSGDDIIDGEAGNDDLDGGAGDDVIYDGGGDDEVHTGSGDDIIYNGGGTDYFDGGDGTDTLIDDLTTDLNSGFEPQSFEVNFNTVTGIHGRADSNIGQDTINKIENFTLIGDFNSYVTGGDEDNIFITAEGNDILTGGAGNDDLNSGAGDDELHGGRGNDTLIGGEGNDELYGDGGDDIIDGGAGDNILRGGEGDDTFFSDSRFAGVNTIYDTAGTGDTLQILDSAGRDSWRFYVTEGSIIRESKLGREDVMMFAEAGEQSIEYVTWIGNSEIDPLPYDDYENKLKLVTSVDVITDAHFTFAGSLDADTITIPEGLVADPSGGQWGEIYLDGGDDYLKLSGDFEYFSYGGTGNDRMIGADGDDHLEGQAGDDELQGGSGSDFLNGGEGYDTAVFEGVQADYEILQVGQVYSITDKETGDTDELHNLELLQFGDGTTMNLGYELVSGGSGDDWLIGGLEGDLIATNGGDDFVYGLAGDDRIEISGVGDVVVDTGEGADEVVIADNAQGSIEVITGGPGDSLIYEGSTDDIAFGYINDNGDLIVGTHDLEITITDQVSYDAEIGKYVVSGIDAIVVEQRGEDSDTDGPASGVFGSDHREGDLLYANAVTDDNNVFAGAGADTIVIGSGNDVAAETSVYGDRYNFEYSDFAPTSYELPAVHFLVEDDEYDPLTTNDIPNNISNLGERLIELEFTDGENGTETFLKYGDKRYNLNELEHGTDRLETNEYYYDHLWIDLPFADTATLDPSKTEGYFVLLGSNDPRHGSLSEEFEYLASKVVSEETIDEYLPEDSHYSHLNPNWISNIATDFGTIIGGGDTSWETQNVSYGDELRFAWAHEDVEITDRLDGFYEVEYVGVGEDAGKVVQFTDIEKLVFEGGANAPVEIQVIDGPVVGSEEWFADGNDWGGAAAGQQVSHGDNNVEFQIAGDTIKVYADISETITWTETETRTVKETYKDSKGRTKTRNVKKTFEVEKSEDVTHEGELIWQGSHNDISGFSFSDDEYVNVISVREFDIGGNAIEMTLGTEDTDLIFGTESDNVIFGAGGDDLIVGGGGNDTILGGSGEDAILGGMGDDLLLGDWDVDVLQDEFGLSEGEIAALLANQLSDGSNDDLVIGGDGIDEVDGGEGRNVVISGGTDLDINQDGDANIQDIEDLIGKDLFDDEHWV